MHPIIVAYVPPSTLYHLLDLEEALTHFRDQNTIVLGDLNANIQSQNPHSNQVTDILMDLGLVDLRQHLGNAGGSDTCNVVSYEARNMVEENI